MLTVKADKRILQKDNQPFFYLADTVWSALTNINMTDWEYYLNKRKEQGFNVLQVNLLPQWDRSKKGDPVYPFEVADGYFNLKKPKESYFDHAEKMMEKAMNKGFTLALVLLWSNHIPGTWAGEFKVSPFFKREDIVEYTETMVTRFKKFQPIYLISGDTDFPTEEVTDYYYDCLEKTHTIDPEGLKVLHIKRGLREIPEKLRTHPGISLYFYQSGHNSEYQSETYNLADYFYRSEPVRPIINSEPCYEFMGYSRNKYGRFSREDVRKAAWQSVLSGAFAGVTYGAHGIWSWHDTDTVFGSEFGEGFAPPVNWRIALEFEGANDYGFLKQFIEEERITSLYPIQSVVLNNTDEIRAAETGEKLYIYLPENTPLKLDGVFDSVKDYAVNLETKQKTPLKKNVSDLHTVINMTNNIKDSLYVLHK